MILQVRVIACLAYGLLLLSSAISTIAQPLTATPESAARGELSEISPRHPEGLKGPGFPRIRRQFNSSDSGKAPASTNPEHALTYNTIIWEITDTLSLTINFGEWRLSSEKIFDTLSAADAAVREKPAAAFLESKFTQRTGIRINAMLFEIGPGFEDRRLTWAEVGEVVGANGLPTFFRQEKIYRSVFFDVYDDVRGKLGEGAVRKWYQVSGGNDTVTASGDLSVS